jgi:hypothetical protein
MMTFQLITRRLAESSHAKAIRMMIPEKLMRLYIIYPFPDTALAGNCAVIAYLTDMMRSSQ